MALFLVQLFVIQQLNPVIQQSRLEMTAVVLLLLLQQGDQAFSDGEQCWSGVFPSSLGVVMPASTWDFRDATRTMKNSSRLLLKMALNWLIQQRGIERLRQNALVEGDPAQFPVDVAVRAQNVGAWLVRQSQAPPKRSNQIWR